jgi:hypothetical protein
MEVVLYRLVYCYPILSDGNRILSDKVIFTLSSKEVGRLPSIRGDRTSPSIISVNKAVYGV